MALVKELIQQHIGSGPILKALIQKMGCIPIIDRNLPADPRRVGPTHGEAVAGMVACLIQGICALYRMEQFAVEEPVLRTLFPQYDAQAWHDDHLGDTLDAIWLTSGVRIDRDTSAPSKNTWRVPACSTRFISVFAINARKAASSARSTPVCRIFNARARNMAPVSKYVKPKSLARRFAKVLLPAPDGPSIAMIN
jgi:hypothetical protein